VLGAANNYAQCSQMNIQKPPQSFSGDDALRGYVNLYSPVIITNEGGKI